MKPGDRVDINFERQRRVHQDIKHPAPPRIVPDPVSDEDIAQLQSDMVGVRSKVARLFDNAASSAKALTVPVHEIATEVKAAVMRLDPNTPAGNKVTFDLYHMAVKRFNKLMSKEDVLKHAAKLTGTTAVDSKVAREEHAGGDVMSGVVGMAGHVAILLLAKKLLAGTMATETQKQTSVKDPKATEAPGIVSSITLSTVILAAMYAGNGPGAVMDAVKSTGLFNGLEDSLAKEGISYDNLVKSAAYERAAGSAEGQMPNIRMYDEPDWHLVHEYTAEWIAGTKEPGYEDWIIAGDMVGVGRDLDTSLAEFSTWAAHPARMAKDTFQLMRCKTDGTNTNMDVLATVLASGYTADLVCCLVRWLGALDTNALKAMRTMLVLLNRLMSLDMKALMGRLALALQNQLRKALIEPIYHMIRRFFSSMCKKVRDWLDPRKHGDEEKWKLLFACTPIDEIVEYLLRALEGVERLLLKLVKDIWADMRLKHQVRRDIYGKLADRKRLSRLIRIIDLVIKAIDRGNLCTKEGTRYPSEKEIREVGRRFLGDLPGPPDFGQAVGDPYHDFNPVTFTTPMGVRIPSVSESAAGERDIDRVSPEDCLKQLTDENIIPLELLEPSEEVSKNVERLRKYF